MRWERRRRSSSSSGLGGSSGSDSTYRSGMGTFWGVESCGGGRVSPSGAQRRPPRPTVRFYLSADVQVVIHRLHVRLSETGGGAGWPTPPLRSGPAVFALSIRPPLLLQPIKGLQAGGDAVNLGSHWFFLETLHAESFNIQISGEINSED